MSLYRGRWGGSYVIGMDYEGVRSGFVAIRNVTRIIVVQGAVISGGRCVAVCDGVLPVHSLVQKPIDRIIQHILGDHGDAKGK